MERHSLIDHGDDLDGHRRMSLLAQDDVFGDEYEAEDFDVVADGFRPPPRDRNSGLDYSGSAHFTSRHPVRTASGRTSILTSPTISRHSTLRSRVMADPFASPEDADAPSSHDRPDSLQFEPDSHPPHRSVSSASSYVYAQSHSPRLGLAGPSHPYGMYPQGTLPRSPSVTTTSTLPRSRRSLSQRTPQHPYAMYPQGVEEDFDDPDDNESDHDNGERIRQNPVQVGFPGLGLNYVRRTDPDNENQDIIGDYGHAEQLPPYTRYPDEGPEKMPLLMPPALHSRAPVAGTDPGMPLMHTAFHPSPAPQSMMDESAQRLVDSDSDLAVRRTETAESGPSTLEEKSWKRKSWKERAKTRVCRIPCWWIMIVVVLIFLVLAFLGGMIGGFIAGRKHAENQFPTITVVTSLLDASVIATPTGTGPPTGTFALSLSPPTATQRSCLTQPNQRVAWDCHLVPNDDIGIIVTPPEGGNNSGAQVFYAAADERIFYGAQAWAMNTPLGQFLTVLDDNDQKNGPAFYWQQYYDKVVVVPESAFNPASNKIRRQALQQLPAGMPAPGDKPWFCVWNNTFLEGFIYMDRPKVAANTTTTPPAPAATLPPSSLGWDPDDNSGSLTPPTAVPPAIITTTFINAQTTATFVGPSISIPSWLSTLDSSGVQAHRLRESVSRAAWTLSLDQEPTPVARRQDADAGAEGGIFASLPEYPLLVKLEERRVADNPEQPYCQQYQILWNMAANWVADANGKPIIVELEEVDPTYRAYKSAGLAAVDEKRAEPTAGCHCQWLSGAG